MPLNAPKAMDFAWIKNGIHLGMPKREELELLKPISIEHSNQKKSALLMLHGFSSSPAVFRFMTPHLTHYDAIHVPVLAGHGYSIEDFSHVSYQQWLKNARIICKTLCQNYEKVDVLGLSLGGLIACHLVKEFKLNHLFLLAPALQLHSPTSFLLLFAKLCQKLQFKLLRNTGGDTYCADVNELLFRQWPIHAVIEVLSFIKNYHFKAWDTPTDLFLGEYDKVIDSKKVKFILQALPQLHTHLLQNSAHVLPIDGDREYIIQEIQNKA
jgi:carboxylesterase